jgi:hypothetical protein
VKENIFFNTIIPDQETVKLKVIDKLERIMKVTQPLRLIRIIALFFLMVFLVMDFSSSLFSLGIGNLKVFKDGNLDEFEIKAYLLEKIIHFIDWPESSNINNTSRPFVIGVFGKTPLKRQLEIIFTERRVKDKIVDIRTVSNIEEISGCHVLFISRAAKPRLIKIINYARKKPILTVGDTKGFCKWDVHITLFFQRENIVFNINELAIQASGLLPNYRLFKHAAKIEFPLRNRK